MKRVVEVMVVLIMIVAGTYALARGEEYPFQVHVSGTGSASIIFIPGMGCSGDVWNGTKALFEKSFTCYTFTIAGFAGVPALGTPDIAEWERAIAKYIQQQKIEKPIIVGHSIGGGIALMLASDYPELISKIVVVDALPCMSVLMNPSWSSQEKPDCRSIVAQLTSMTDDQFYQMQKQGMKQLVMDGSNQELIAHWTCASDRKTFAELYCEYSNIDLRNKLSAIHCPALILLESYFVHYKEPMEAQYAPLKTADIRYATKGLHFIMYDDTEWYENQLKKFIHQ